MGQVETNWMRGKLKHVSTCPTIFIIEYTGSSGWDDELRFIHSNTVLMLTHSLNPISFLITAIIIGRDMGLRCRYGEGRYKKLTGFRSWNKCWSFSFLPSVFHKIKDFAEPLIFLSVFRLHMHCVRWKTTVFQLAPWAFQLTPYRGKLKRKFDLHKIMNKFKMV